MKKFILVVIALIVLAGIYFVIYKKVGIRSLFFNSNTVQIPQTQEEFETSIRESVVNDNSQMQKELYSNTISDGPQKSTQLEYNLEKQKKEEFLNEFR